MQEKVIIILKDAKFVQINVCKKQETRKDKMVFGGTETRKI